jgi:predicted NodU family carbamoyl transferase
LQGFLFVAGIKKYQTNTNRWFVFGSFLRTATKRTQNIADETAQILAENKIICWFQGRMAFGQRALGSRSILAPPTHYGEKIIMIQKYSKRYFNNFRRRYFL